MTKLADGKMEILKVPRKDNTRGIRIIFNKRVETKKIYKIEESGIYMRKITVFK